jgi:hypothetical protein
MTKKLSNPGLLGEWMNAVFRKCGIPAILVYWLRVRMPAELASSRGLIIKRLTVFRVIFCP